MSTPKRPNSSEGDNGPAHRAAAKHAPPRMATPARADRMTVEELLKLATDGRLRVPSFQRALKWDADDKWKLLDSMERGYPIGTLLLWKRAASTEDIGSPLPRGPASPSQGDVYLIVDGQQRITTLWGALALAPEAAQPTIVFDMVTEKFVVRALKKTERGIVGSIGEGGVSPALPMHIALDAVTLSEWVPSALPREVKLRYYEVGKRLREYLIPIYVVEGDDTEILRNIFDRTNSTGKALTRDEVFDALVGSQIGSTGERGFGIVHDQLRDLGFGSIDRSTILKTFEAIRGEKIGKLDPRGQDLRAAEKDLLGTARAAEDCGVSSIHRRAPRRGAALRAPARGAGAPVPSVREPGREEPRSAQAVVLAGAIAGRHGGASGTLQQHVDDVRPNDEHGSVKRLLDRTGEARKPDLGTLARDEISIASARGKVILCALFSHAPRNLSTGDKIVPDELFGDAPHEVMLRIVQPSESKLGSTIGNRLLHPSIDVAPSRLVRDCNDEGALASHAIDRSSQGTLRQGHVDAFLKRRAEVLAEWILQFVDTRAEWDRPDTPSVKVLAQRKKAS